MQLFNAVKVKLCFVLSVLLVGIVFSLPAPTSVSAVGISQDSVLQILTKSVESYVPGCVDCPRTATRTPAFANVVGYDSLLGAKKIVTFAAPPNVYNYATSAGGCAITSSSEVMCWGANGAGQLGNGSFSPSSVPVKAQGIQRVSDIAASGGTTCVVSAGDLLCVGLGPWPNSLSISSTWVKLNIEPVKSVFMGTHIASSVRSPICVLTVASAFKCLRTNSVGGTPATFSWIDSGLGPISDAVSSQTYYPGQSNVCLLELGAIKCGLVDNFGTFTLQRTLTSGVLFSRLYLFQSGYPAVCGWSNGLLACGKFSYPRVYEPPTELRIVGIVPEPSSIVYREIDTVRKVYILHSSGVLYINTDFLDSSTYAYGSSGSIIAPVLASKELIQGTSINISGISGVTNTIEIMPVSVNKSNRALLGSRVVTVTSGGQPIVGSRITWATTDDPSFLQSSGGTVYTTDLLGQVRFPQLASGALTFTISGGRVENGAFLQTAVVTFEVDASLAVNLEVPIPPLITSRKISVMLPDGQPVPNAEIRLKNAFLTYAFSSSISARSAWSAQEPDANKYLSSVACAFCMVNPPTYLTDANGVALMPIFVGSAKGADFDATVFYDDGIISQSVNIDNLSSDVEAKFQFMQNVKVDVPSIVDLANPGEATLSANITDELGIPIVGEVLSAKVVCDAVVFGGLWSQGLKVANNVCSDSFTRSVSKKSIHSSAAKCQASGISNSKGDATIQVCVAKSMLVRVQRSGFVSSKTICIRVSRIPCQKSYQPFTAKDAEMSMTVGKGRRVTAKSLATFGGLKIAKGSMIYLSAGEWGASGCQVSATSMRVTTKGYCRVNVSVKPTKGKTKKVTVVVRSA